jgi:hypothetical protein
MTLRLRAENCGSSIANPDMALDRVAEVDGISRRKNVWLFAGLRRRELFDRYDVMAKFVVIAKEKRPIPFLRTGFVLVVANPYEEALLIIAVDVMSVHVTLPTS